MNKKKFTAVITLVSINQLCFSDNKYISNLIKKYNIKIFKTS